jgi:hypothetical protein
MHRRLDNLGVLCFNLDKGAPGGCRFTCLLPTAQQGRSHRIETRAATEAEAVRLAVAEAERWAGRK